MRTHILTALKAAAFLCVGLLTVMSSVLHAQPTAYVANLDDGTVTPIDIATNTAGTPISVGSEPEGIAITPDGVTAYVVNRGSNNVTPINIATGIADTPIPVGNWPTAVAITPNGVTAYVTNLSSGTVTPITIATGTASTPISVGGGPWGIAITPDGATRLRRQQQRRHRDAHRRRYQHGRHAHRRWQWPVRRGDHARRRYGLRRQH